MFINKIPCGKDTPHDINVMIEIPAKTGPVKYEIDKDSGAIFVDRFVATSMSYPVHYGFVPNTLALDNDPLDVLVFADVDLVVGSVINVRPIGVFMMEDESGEDAKIIAVPTDDIVKDYENIQSIDDLPKSVLERIAHYFEHYKDLEPKKWVKVTGYQDMQTAKDIILASIKRAK